MTEYDTAKLIAIAAPYYQNFKPTKAEIEVMVKAWHRQVGHIEYAIGEAAMLDACSRCKQFMPTPADVLESYERITTPPQLQGAEAWALVMDEVRRGVGYPYAGIPDEPIETTITDPVILRCVKAVGGWHGLQKSTSEQDISNRSQFIRAYDGIRKAEREQARELPAVTEARNRVASVLGSVVKQLETR
ncbi:replisome organizer [Caudoviricetes sp.]|nr:replisome organizer [Caudoviricetes sp.]UOF81086.1 replisome organizer [Caudoviricetes sp.]UOF82431.1 replisome organizer [Caudoviricetes sp.]UOF82607.1 replisome organizer [Caudoviricetes sp.]